MASMGLLPGMRNIHYWQYFVALEADLAATARYVEPTSANMACYSVEFARILLTAGSEVDVLCKVLCQEHQLPVRPVNIDGYRAAITKRFAGFTAPAYEGVQTALSTYEAVYPNCQRLKLGLRRLYPLPSK
jgi:hypothetical protein